MADETVVHIGENSPERIAHLLYREIRGIEKKDGALDRKWILDTYAECLSTVRQPSIRGSGEDLVI